MSLKQPHRAAVLTLCLLLCNSFPASAESAKPQLSQSLYSFSLVKPDGRLVALADYKGKVVVIVNLASKSTFAEQVPQLSKLEDTYKDQGLVLLGIPSNDFGAEEPGDDSEIQKLYAGQHVTFPVLAKSSVCGKDKLPLYGFLTASGKSAKGKEPAAPDDVHWSFTKFIITREGQVGARFESDVTPDSPEFAIAIEKALAGKLKPATKPVPPPATAAGNDDDDEDGGR